MLMNENSELRSFVSCSKNFSKNIINKSIKNNIVLINNDGGVKSKRKHRGFIPSTFAVTLTYIKFSLFIKTVFLINSLTNIIFSIPISIIILSHIKFYIYIFFLIATYISFCIIIYILFFIIICSLIYILFIIFIVPLTTKKMPASLKPHLFINLHLVILSLFQHNHHLLEFHL